MRIYSAFVLILITSSLGHAQTSGFDDHYQRGSQLAAAGKYLNALREYEAAYRLQKESTLALNIGLLHLKLMHAKQAQQFCSQYLREEQSTSSESRAKATDCLLKAASLASKGPKRTEGKPVETGSGQVESPEGNPPTSPPASVPDPPQSTTPATASVNTPAAPIQPDAVKPSIDVTPTSLTAANPQASASSGSTDLSPSTSRPDISLAVGAASTAPKAVEPEARPVYKKWWFWTIIGVAAAGAATGIAVGVTATRAPEDPLGSFMLGSRRVLEF